MPRLAPNAASLAARADALAAMHARLDDQLGEEIARPLPDLAVVQDLKRRKLKTKDELAELEGVLRLLDREPGAPG